MTNRLELNWKLDGFVDEQRYYCSETPIDPLNLPAPKDVLAGDVRTYTDVDIDVGKTYYICIGAVKNGVEKLSDEKLILAGIAWEPNDLATKPKLHGTMSVLNVDSENRISRLIDQSGNGNHFDQTVNNLKPILINDEILFDGLDDYLIGVSSTLSMLNNASNAWLFTVVRRTFLDSNNIDRTIFNIHRSTSHAVRFNAQLNSSESTLPNVINFGTRRLDSDAFINLFATTPSSADYQIILFKADYASGVKEIYVNGVLNATQAVSTGTISNTNAIRVPSIGAFFTGSEYARHSNMGVKSITIGTSPLTLLDRQKLEGWAAHKYGLKANLPPDHPYKVLVPTI